MKPSTLLSRMNALSRFAFIATVILIPFLFIPFSTINTFVVKGALLTIGVTVSVLAFAIARFVDGELSFPKTRINITLMFILLVTLISAVFSPNFYKSMFGYSFEVGTFSSILSLSLLYFIGVRHTNDEKTRKKIIRGIFVAFIASFVVVLASVVFSGNVLFAKIFKGIAGGTIIGSWTDFGIFSAVIVLFSVCYSALGQQSRIRTIMYWLSIVLGLLVLALVNITSLWVIVGLFSLVFFVYTVSLSHRPGALDNTEKQNRLPISAFLVVVVCILFTLGNSIVGTLLSSRLGFVSDYVQPSASATALVYKGQTIGNPLRAIIGVGPNRFTEAWMRFKPIGINSSVYWDTAFPSGFGSIMTMGITTGAIGFVAWIFFLLIYFVTGIRVLLAQLKTEYFDSTLVTTFFVSAFLWVAHLLIVSNITIFVLAFSMTTLFVGSLISRKIIIVSTSTYLKDPRNSFFTILLLICIMIGSIVSLYFSSIKLVSIVYYTKATEVNSFDLSQKYLQHAIQLQNKNDNYYRTLSMLYTNKLNLTLTNERNTPNFQTNVQTLLNAAQSSSTQAVAVDNNNYINWLSLAQFFESAASLQIAGEPYKNGVVAYEKVAYFVPSSPAIPLAQARLELTNKNVQGAQDFINKSLSLKKDYVGAYQIRAQIAYDNKDYKEAIDQLTQGIVLNPKSADLYVSRGTVEIQAGSYNDASNDFRAAFSINPNQNIAYLLAQSDIKSGNFDEASSLIDSLMKLNPNNSDIKDLKDKLEQSKNSASAVQPVDSTKKVDNKK